MRLGVIGGTGTAALFGEGALAEPETTSRATSQANPWGNPSADLYHCTVDGQPLTFLQRHGDDGLSGNSHRAIPPHQINYRANIWALREAGVDRIVGINVVGGITPNAVPGALVVPDQLIDYTWGRQHSYMGEAGFPLRHVDFTSPFDADLRAALLKSAAQLGLSLLSEATYGVTQGPRLESAAEINRLERDGCHVVGMTAMPEAALARELDLAYAVCCVVVNRAAGRSRRDVSIHAEAAAHLDSGIAKVRRLIYGLLASQ
ncbi:MAG: S-methyl-5'-thioinosine phosphorylase [Gammaproteobacteria bacterium]